MSLEPLLKKSKPVSETSSAVDTPRKVGTPRESIHSSSDRELLHALPKINKQMSGQEESDVRIAKRFDCLLQ